MRWDEILLSFSIFADIQCRKKLTTILLDEVKERTEKGALKQDFMQIMLDSTDENGEKMSEMEVVENIVSLILGGYESTSNVMTWALYYLAKYPEVLEKLKVKKLLPLIYFNYCSSCYY